MRKKTLFKTLFCAGAFVALLCFNSCDKLKPEETKCGRIQGFVTSTVTNEPIQGVDISLSPSGLSAVTGSDGRYEFNDIEVGQYTVQGMKTG